MRSITILKIFCLLSLLAPGSNSSILAQKIGNAKLKTINQSGPIKRSSRFLKTASIRIHYLEWNPNSKSTVVLLHGLFDTAETWTTVAPLIARGHRVIAPDRRGSGRTDKPVDGYDFPTLAADILSLIDELKLPRVHLVGHSSGAGVAFTAATKAPEKIVSVAMIDGGFWPKKKEVVGAKPNPSCKARPSVCLRSVAIERGSMEYDPEPLYERFVGPAILIVGYPPKPEAIQFAKEIGEAHSSAEKVAKEKLRYGQFVVIRETSHWIQRDQPVSLARILAKFFENNSPTSASKPDH